MSGKTRSVGSVARSMSSAATFARHKLERTRALLDTPNPDAAALQEVRELFGIIQGAVSGLSEDIHDLRSLAWDLEAVSDAVDRQDAVLASRILVVDDDPEVHTLVEEALHGYEVVGMTDGSDAIAALEHGRKFDLVLCDIVMLGATGIDVYNYVVEHDLDVARRFIFMTAGEFSDLMREFVNSMDSSVLVIHKPLEPKMLRWVVDQQVRIS